MNNIDKFDYEGISLHSKSWEESEKKLKDSIDNCYSVSKLRKLRRLFEDTLEQIRLSKVFFRCESNVNHTKISLSLYDGTEFMSFICLGCIKEVFPDEQEEILKCISHIYEASINRIDERLIVVEKINEKEKTKDFITSIIMVILGIIFSISYPDVTEIIVENMNTHIININFVKNVINIAFALLGLFFLAKSAFIVLKWYIRENL